MKEKVFSMTGNDFDVTEGRGRTIAFTIRGDSTSLHDSRVLRDSRGRPVYRMKMVIVSMHRRMVVKHCGSGEPIVTIRRKSAMPFTLSGGGTVRVWRGGNDAGQPWVEIRGEHEGNEFIIEDAAWGDEVATVKRRTLSLRYLFLRKCTYVLKLRPGCNAALMVFLVSAVHDQYRQP